MEKLLTVVIPCYNSEEYMGKAVASALSGGDDVEDIIVDDGSTDSTPELADVDATKFPDRVKVIHKENGGHGDAVTKGIYKASGIYIKILDSDDWLDKKAFRRVLEALRKHREPEEQLDCVMSNYVYEKVGKRYKRVMRYRGALPENKVIGWDTGDKIKFAKSQYVVMHSVIYRTKMLTDMGLELPKHTFYVDNIYVFKPMQHVKKLMYVNEDLYRYYIGRDDQSVNEKNMIKRIDQHINVTKIIIDYFSQNKPENKQLYRFQRQYVDMMMCIASSIALVAGTKEMLEKKKDIWNYLKEKDPALYKELRHTLLGVSMNLPGPVGRKLSVAGYRVVQRLFGFN